VQWEVILADDGYMLAWSTLGGPRFTFMITTAAFQKLQRSDTWRWVTQERFNNDPAEQYVGRGSKTIKLEGIIYAAYNPGGASPGAVTKAVGTQVLQQLRELADAGIPRRLVTGRGQVLGDWVLVGMSEEQEYFLQNGAPQKQVFSLEFRSYGDDASTTNGEVPYDPATGGIATDPSVAAKFQDLIGTLGSDTARLATLLSDPGGLSDADARQAAIDTGTVARNNKISGDDADQLAHLMNIYGLVGKKFLSGLLAVTNIFLNTNRDDIVSVLDTGLPAINTALAGLGVQDKNAAVNAIALLDVAPSNQDRGAYLERQAGQLTAAAGNPALENLGVNFNDQTVPAVDRVSNALAKMGQLQNDNPAGLENALPKAGNPELYGAVAASSTGQFDAERHTLESSGLSGSTPIVTPVGPLQPQG
jgi:phage protein U